LDWNSLFLQDFEACVSTSRDGPTSFNVLKIPFTSPITPYLPCNGLSNDLASVTLVTIETNKETRIRVRNVTGFEQKSRLIL
jgi:hypothetical protein